MEKVTSRIKNIFKENALYGLQKILLDNFHRNVYIWSAIVNGTCTQKFKIGLKTNIFRRLYFRFTQFYAALNFRSADFDSSSWRVHLYLVMARSACRLGAHVQRKTLSSLLKKSTQTLFDEHQPGADPGEVKWVNFHPPFSEPPSFFFFLSLKYWNNIWFLWLYYKNSPPISKSWIRPCQRFGFWSEGGSMAERRIWNP